MSDLTRLLQTLQPTPDGESAVRHRTALVDVVNADGTVDLDFDGTVVPDVSVLDGAVISAGSVVQVAAWAGDLLVLGSARTAQTGVRGTLGYAQATASQGGITAEVDLTSLAVTVTVGTGRRIKITGQGSFAGGSGTTVLWIKEGAAYLQNGNMDMPGGNSEILAASVVLTPSAGSHSYKLAGQATGTATGLVASATSPAFILVEDIGPA